LEGFHLSKLQWIFYGFSRKEGKEALDKEFLMEHISQLFYWCSKEKIFQETTVEICQWLHGETWSDGEEIHYMELLLDGVTHRARKHICEELRWLLQKNYSENPEETLRRLEMIRQKNVNIYTHLVCEDYEKENTYNGDIFKAHMGSFRSMNEYLSPMNLEIAPADWKDQIIRSGIALLNQNLFREEGYREFDNIMNRLDRQKQWIIILRDFVAQLESRAELLDDAQLHTACYVEQLLTQYDARGQKGILQKEQRDRQAKNEGETIVKKEKMKEEKDWEEELEAEYEETWETGGGSFLDFIMTASPQGFLTGCILYLSNYALMIGHWKISVGMAGMWVLLMLNYIYLLQNKKEKYSLWKSIGACVMEGFLIEIFAAFFRSQKMRLYYFILLGVVAVIIQMGNIIRKKSGTVQGEE
jgi:hypothetical protein